MLKIKSKTALKVGLLILASLIILTLGILYLMEFSFLSNSRIVSFEVRDSGNLEFDDPILISGVRVGKVKSIKIRKEKIGNNYLSTGAIIEFRMDAKIFIPEDSIFRIDSFGLLGERGVTIIMGTSTKEMDYSKPGKGITSPGLPEEMAKVTDIYLSLHQKLSEISAIADSIAKNRNPKSFLTNLENTTENFKELTSENNKSITVHINNFKNKSDSLLAFINANKDKVNKSIEEINTVSERLEFFSSEMETLSISIKEIIEEIERDNGMAKTIVNDKKVYNDLKRISKTIDKFIEDIKNNPIKFEVF